jgi:hypothetical protein
VEALRRDLPQLFLGEQRDLVPDVLRPSLGNSFPQERRLPRPLDSDLLALALDFFQLSD